MMEPPVDPPPLSKKKYFLVLAGMMAVFYIVAPYLLGGVVSLVFPIDDVELGVALTDARVTGFEMNRQQYNYQLDGNIYKHYYFNAFVAANPANRTDMDSRLGYDPSDLSHYLRPGDRITKAAGSPRLTVRRGPVVTHWILYSSTPESKLPPPVKIAILPGGDTVVIE